MFTIYRVAYAEQTTIINQDWIRITRIKGTWEQQFFFHFYFIFLRTVYTCNNC